MKEIVLAALDGFTCLGSRCPDNCCAHPWQIPVDPGTYEKWSSMEAGPERDRLFASLDISEQNGTKLIRIKQDTGNRCPHLTTDMLCGLQVRHGGDFLSDVCRTYPRIRTANTVRTFSSASLSCPEIARLVLFPTSAEPVFRQTTDTGPDAERAAVMSDPIAYYLDNFTREVLDQTKYPLRVRIVFLARQLMQLAKESDEGKLTTQGLQNMYRTLRDGLYETNRAIKSSTLRPDPLVAGAFWNAIYGVSRPLFDSTIADIGSTELLEALRSNAPVAEEKYRKIYEAMLRAREAARPILTDHAPAFERYFAALLMNHGFPWNPATGNHVATFISTIFPFATTWLFLWLLVASGKSIGQEDIVTAVYRADRTLTHSDKIPNLLDSKRDALRLDTYYHCLVHLG